MGNRLGHPRVTQPEAGLLFIQVVQGEEGVPTEITTPQGQVRRREGAQSDCPAPCCQDQAVTHRRSRPKARGGLMGRDLAWQLTAVPSEHDRSRLLGQQGTETSSSICKFLVFSLQQARLL